MVCIGKTLQCGLGFTNRNAFLKFAQAAYEVCSERQGRDEDEQEKECHAHARFRIPIQRCFHDLGPAEEAVFYRPFSCLATIVCRNAKTTLQRQPKLIGARLGNASSRCRSAAETTKAPSSLKLCDTPATLAFVPAMEPNFRLHNSCGARLARPSRARLGISVRKNFEPGWPLDISQRPFSCLGWPVRLLG